MATEPDFSSMTDDEIYAYYGVDNPNKAQTAQTTQSPNADMAGAISAALPSENDLRGETAQTQTTAQSQAPYPAPLTQEEWDAVNAGVVDESTSPVAEGFKTFFGSLFTGQGRKDAMDNYREQTRGGGAAAKTAGYLSDLGNAFYQGLLGGASHLTEAAGNLTGWEDLVDASRQYREDLAEYAPTNMTDTGAVDENGVARRQSWGDKVAETGKDVMRIMGEFAPAAASGGSTAVARTAGTAAQWGLVGAGGVNTGFDIYRTTVENAEQNGFSKAQAAGLGIAGGAIDAFANAFLMGKFLGKGAKPIEEKFFQTFIKRQLGGALKTGSVMGASGGAQNVIQQLAENGEVNLEATGDAIKDAVIQGAMFSMMNGALHSPIEWSQYRTASAVKGYARNRDAAAADEMATEKMVGDELEAHTAESVAIESARKVLGDEQGAAMFCERYGDAAKEFIAARMRGVDVPVEAAKDIGDLAKAFQTQEDMNAFGDRLMQYMNDAYNAKVEQRARWDENLKNAAEEETEAKRKRENGVDEAGVNAVFGIEDQNARPSDMTRDSRIPRRINQPRGNRAEEGDPQVVMRAEDAKSADQAADEARAFGEDVSRPNEDYAKYFEWLGGREDTDAMRYAFNREQEQDNARRLIHEMTRKDEAKEEPAKEEVEPKPEEESKPAPSPEAPEAKTETSAPEAPVPEAPTAVAEPAKKSPLRRMVDAINAKDVETGRAVENELREEIRAGKVPTEAEIEAATEGMGEAGKNAIRKYIGQMEDAVKAKADDAKTSETDAATAKTDAEVREDAYNAWLKRQVGKNGKPKKDSRAMRAQFDKMATDGKVDAKTGDDVKAETDVKPAEPTTAKPPSAPSVSDKAWRNWLGTGRDGSPIELSPAEEKASKKLFADLVKAGKVDGETGEAIAAKETEPAKEKPAEAKPVATKESKPESKAEESAPASESPSAPSADMKALGEAAKAAQKELGSLAMKSDAELMKHRAMLENAKRADKVKAIDDLLAYRAAAKEAKSKVGGKYAGSVDEDARRLDSRTVGEASSDDPALLDRLGQRMAKLVPGVKVRVGELSEGAKRSGATAEFDPATGEVVVSPDAPMSDVVHEIGGHGTLEWAKRNAPALYSKCLEYVRTAPKDVKDFVYENYRDFADRPDKIVHEIFAQRFARENGAEFQKLLEEPKARKWWTNVVNAVRSVFQDAAKRNGVDTSRLRGMDAKGFMKGVAEQMAMGRELNRWTAFGRDAKYLEDAGVKVAPIGTVVSEDENGTLYSIADKPPKVIRKAYAVYDVDENGGLHPAMIAQVNPRGEPAMTWLQADTAPIKRDKDGNIKTNTRGRISITARKAGVNGRSGENELSWRPGKHLATYPNAKQFRNKNGLVPRNMVFFEVEYSGDHDYQLESFEHGTNDKGKYTHNAGGLPYIPKDGFYMHRTNAMPDVPAMIITDKYRVARALTDAEAKDIVKGFGAEWFGREGGDLTEADLKRLHISADELKAPSDLSSVPSAHDESDYAASLPAYRRKPIDFSPKNKALVDALRENGQDFDAYKAEYESGHAKEFAETGYASSHRYGTPEQVKNIGKAKPYDGGTEDGRRFNEKYADADVSRTGRGGLGRVGDALERLDAGQGEVSRPSGEAVLRAAREDGYHLGAVEDGERLYARKPFRDGETEKHGMETLHVYRDGDTVYKYRRPEVTPGTELEKVRRHNELFGDRTGYEVVGVAETEDGRPSIVLKQPYVDFVPKSGNIARKQLEADLRRRFGRVEVSEDGTEMRAGGWIVDDLKDANFGLDAKTGRYAVIDALVHRAEDFGGKAPKMETADGGERGGATVIGPGVGGGAEGERLYSRQAHPIDHARLQANGVDDAAHHYMDKEVSKGDRSILEFVKSKNFREGLSEMYFKNMADRFRPVRNVIVDSKMAENMTRQEAEAWADNDKASPYHQLRVLSGKTETNMKRMEAIFNDLKDDLKGFRDLGIDVDDLSVFSYAKHAPARNAQKLKDSGVADGSGISDALANDIVSGRQFTLDGGATMKQYTPEQLKALQGAHDRLVKRMNAEFGLKFMHDHGLIDRDSMNRMLGAYGIEHVNLRDEIEGGAPVSPSMPTIGKPVKNAKGRSSALEDNAIVHSVSDTFNTIANAIKNDAAESLAQYVEQHPEMGEVRVKTPTDKVDEAMVEFRRNNPVKDASGKVVGEKNQQMVVVLYGKRGVDLSHAFREQDVVHALPFIQNVSRAWASFATQLSPTFSARNFMKDTVEVALDTIATDGPMAAAKFLKNQATLMPLWNREFRRVFNEYSKTGRVVVGDGASDIARYFKEYVESGALIGGGGAREGYGKTERSLKEVSKELAGIEKGVGKVAKAWEWYKEKVGKVNESIEMLTRFSNYYNRRANLGESVEKAAINSREASTDFGMYGDQRYLNSIFTFSNSILGGTMRATKSMVKNKWGRTLAVGMVAMGMLEEFLNSDDDDESVDANGGKSNTNVSEYERENGFRIRVGDKYVRIPTHLGPWSVLKYLGGNMARAAMGQISWDKAAGNVRDSATTMLSHFSGTGEHGFGKDSPSLINSFTPSVLQPFVQIASNEDYKGEKIHREHDLGDAKYAPDFKYAKKGTGAVWVGLSRALNNIPFFSGGSDLVKGRMSVPPEDIEYLAKQIVKNFGTDVVNTALLPATAYNVATGEEELSDNLRNIPLVKDFLKDMPDITKRYYEAKDRHAEEGQAFKNSEPNGKAAYLREHPTAAMNLSKLESSIKNLSAMLRGEIVDKNGKVIGTYEPTEAKKQSIRKVLRKQMANYVRIVERKRR